MTSRSGGRWPESRNFISEIFQKIFTDSQQRVNRGVIRWIDKGLENIKKNLGTQTIMESLFRDMKLVFLPLSLGALACTSESAHGVI